jgi:hypothetical protein
VRGADGDDEVIRRLSIRQSSLCGHAYNKRGMRDERAVEARLQVTTRVDVLLRGKGWQPVASGDSGEHEGWRANMEW